MMVLSIKSCYQLLSHQTLLHDNSYCIVVCVVIIIIIITIIMPL